MAHQPVVYTIGHSTRGFEEVVEMLRHNGVDLLVDIRSYPSSRKYPQWYQKAIQENLPSDIAYTWLQKLGGRRHTPAGAATPNTGWRVKAFRDYADYMATDEWREGIDELVALATEHTPAIMCSEAVPWRCHRRLVTDGLLVRGVEVRDIMSESSVKQATLTDFAKVKGTSITYPDAPPGQDALEE